MTGHVVNTSFLVRKSNPVVADCVDNESQSCPEAGDEATVAREGNTRQLHACDEPMHVS